MTQSKIDKNDTCKLFLRAVADEALKAFWQVVVQLYPHAETGELPPLTTVRLRDAAEVAIEEWIRGDVFTTPSG
jgi:hypothetical protein